MFDQEITLKYIDIFYASDPEWCSGGIMFLIVCLSTHPSHFCDSYRKLWLDFDLNLAQR